MRRHLKIYSILALFQLAGCAQYMPHRSFLSEMESEARNFFAPEEDFPVVAGDTGRLGETAMERRSRTPASSNDYLQVRNRLALEHELTKLEGMQSEEDFRFYKKCRNHLTTTSERIFFLKLPPRDRADYLEAKGIESKDPEAYFSATEKIMAIKQADIIMGMNKDEVIESWGRPLRVEIAGNPNFENERWIYDINGASKYIYFESGRVEGWE